MSKGISNVEIERAFNEIYNADLNDNFVGVFLFDKTNRFISFKK